MFTIAFITLTIAIMFFVAASKKLEQKRLASNLTTNAEQTLQHNSWNKHKWIVKTMASSTMSQAIKPVDKVYVQPNNIENENAAQNITVNVWIEESQAVQAIELEDYVLAVVLSEMPWSFHDEALKAQMIAARTYIMYRLERDNKDFDVTNSTKHQVFKSIDATRLSDVELERYNYITQLLEETKGKVITYENNLIDALYFSTSNGKTESAEHYFGSDIPYLKSVKSSWDKHISPSFEQQFTFATKQFLNLLIDAKLIDQSSDSIEMSILEKSESNRIVKLNVNGSEITAKQLREALGIASTDFTWKLNRKENQITITTFGYGHGVGMSQWGAEGMAREGHSAEQILHHYYNNIEIKSL